MLKHILIVLFISLNLFSQSQIIGKSDKIDIPQLNLYNLNAKVDTGAKTSSLHCSYIDSLDDKFVEFIVLGPSREKFQNKKYTMPIKRIANVKSSNGKVDKRYFIELELILFNKTYITQVSLSQRKNMKFPMLLGRHLLKQGFIVDVREQNISFKEKQSSQ